jgi:hypothetical protein
MDRLSVHNICEVNLPVVDIPHLEDLVKSFTVSKLNQFFPFINV